MNNNFLFCDIMNQSADIQSLPCIQLQLDGLFNPIIRVIPAADWSKIKAIWIPLLHHDYDNRLTQAEKIKILESKTDKFGTVQGYLTARNENYIPYLTTFFNPTWTQEFVIQQIVQAYDHQIETVAVVMDQTHEQILKKTIIGQTKQKMLICITIKEQSQTTGTAIVKSSIIDASPLFFNE